MARTPLEKVQDGFWEALANDENVGTEKPHDNGDGTVTLHGVPVTVPAAWLEGGREVEAVRVQNFLGGERVRIITSDPKPQFEVGKWYKNTDGDIRGPLRRVDWMDDYWCWMDQENRSYEPTGVGKNEAPDLQPGALTVWQPAMPLDAGEYRWDGESLWHRTAYVMSATLRSFCRGWIDPPKKGRYTIATDGGIAVWEGEA